MVLADQKLNQQGPDHTSSTNCNADPVLTPGKWVTPHSDTTKLDQQDLYDKGNNHNEKEDPIIEEISENVQVIS